eukprot:3829605-Prymnesium_polylepis.1
MAGTARCEKSVRQWAGGAPHACQAHVTLADCPHAPSGLASCAVPTTARAITAGRRCCTSPCWDPDPP